MASTMNARGLRVPGLVLALLLAVAVLACDGGGDADPTASPDPTEASAGATTAASTPATSPDPEQVLLANLTSEPNTLDPQRASDQVSLTVVRNLYSALLRLDEQDELVPDLAEEIPTEANGGISEDGLTYTFHLREGLTWSDGEPLVAQAFVDAAHRLFQPGSGNPYVDFYRILAAPNGDGTDANVAVQEAIGAGQEDVSDLEQAVVESLRVEAPDDRTVVYHLNRRSPEFLLLASLWSLSPVRQDLVEEHGDRWTEAGNHVSNGPFVLEVWDHGERLRLARNEHWHRGPAQLEAIEFDLIDDTSVAYLAYRNDELDVVLLGPAELVQVRGDEALREQFIGYPQLTTFAIYANAEDPLLSDVRVRQALAGSIERVQYTNAVLEGNAIPAYSWIPPGMPGYDAEVGSQYQDALDESRELLADTGAADVEVTLLVPEASSAVLTAEWLQGQWQTNLGITVRLDVRETASYVSAYNNSDFQMALGGWTGDYPDPQNWLPTFTTGAPLNVGNYSNTRYDDLIAEAEAEVDFDRRLALYEEAHALLVDEAGVIPLNHPLRGALVKPWVQGLDPSPREGIVPGDLAFDQIQISERP